MNASRKTAALLLLGLLSTTLFPLGENSLWVLGAAGALLLLEQARPLRPRGWISAGLACGLASYPLMLVYLMLSGQPELRLEDPLFMGEFPSWGMLPALLLWLYGGAAAVALCADFQIRTVGRTRELSLRGWICVGLAAVYGLCLVICLMGPRWMCVTFINAIGLPSLTGGSLVCRIGGWSRIFCGLFLLAFAWEFFRRTVLGKLPQPWERT